MAKKPYKIKWRNINFNDPLLNGEGLITLEECTDYNLSDGTSSSQRFKRKNINDIKNKTKKKRKISNNFKDQCSVHPSEEGCTLSTNLEVSDNIDPYEDVQFGRWANFGLPVAILRAIQTQGFVEPTGIQALTLAPAILGRRDIVGAAETGSGKTLAFGLPILTGILNEKDKIVEKEVDQKEKPLYALILTPTRELAVQIKNHLTSIAKFIDVNIAVIVGGMAAVKQERILNKGPEIVVATPGRLWELIQQGNVHLSQISDIKYLAVDETDRMLEKGHFEELHELLERLNSDETKKKSRQNFVFSATLSLVHELPKYLLNKMKKVNKLTPEHKLRKIIDVLGITNPKIVDISEGKGNSSTLTECRISCDIEEKDYFVYYFLQEHPGRTLIFCNSIGSVRRLTNLLGILSCSALSLHASMQQKQRLRNLERFQANENGILVATDVAARGLDIPKIDHVLHYQTPRTTESYIHRSGRTARASRQGITIVLVEPSELQSYVRLCRTLNRSEDLPIFPVQDNYLHAIKQCVNLAREIDKLELEMRKVNSENGWLQKAAEEMDIVVDDFEKKYDQSVNSANKKLVHFKRKHLESLLAKPIFPKGFSGKYPLMLSDRPTTLKPEEPPTAVEVMRVVIEKAAKDKKSVALFKPRRNKII